jgi:hypothetical protein
LRLMLKKFTFKHILIKIVKDKNRNNLQNTQIQLILFS